MKRYMIIVLMALLMPVSLSADTNEDSDWKVTTNKQGAATKSDDGVLMFICVKEENFCAYSFWQSDMACTKGQVYPILVNFNPGKAGAIKGKCLRQADDGDYGMMLFGADNEAFDPPEFINSEAVSFAMAGTKVHFRSFTFSLKGSANAVYEVFVNSGIKAPSTEPESNVF